MKIRKFSTIVKFFVHLVKHSYPLPRKLAKPQPMNLNYSIDPLHSAILFKIKHLGITSITGCFKEFSGKASFGASDFSDAHISFEAKTDSICTRHEERDEHLRSEDFFHTSQFPNFTFSSSAFERTGENTFLLTGFLEIKGIRNQQQFEVRYNGEATDQFGNTRIGFDLSGELDRRDYTLDWNLVSEMGMMILAEHVELDFSLQLVLINN